MTSTRFLDGHDPVVCACGCAVWSATRGCGLMPTLLWCQRCGEQAPPPRAPSIRPPRTRTVSSSGPWLVALMLASAAVGACVRWAVLG